MMTGNPEREEAAQVRVAMSVWLRRGATAMAASRVGVGIVALAAPAVVAQIWVGGAGDGPSGHVRGRVLGRALGGRDLALGLGALAALRRERAAGVWVGLGALADGVDLMATARSWRDLPSPQRWLVALSSGGAAAVGAVAAVSLAIGSSPQRGEKAPA
jgi:hypothetical protein